MNLIIPSFDYGERIPAQHAFGIPADDAPMVFGPNVSPAVAWSDVPQNTLSLALICHDVDVPSVGNDVNRAGHTVPFDLPRVDFFHWVLVDIPVSLAGLDEGLESQSVVAHGKPASRTMYGVRGINSYTNWFASDPAMSGNYGGYDGPCPPWNDERLHHYFFTLYALDVPTLGLGLDDVFDGVAARQAIEGHVLAQAQWMGTYALNPSARDA